MKTDSELRNDVLSELQWDASIRNEDIAIAVKDGVVTLAGTVDNYAQRYAAERAVERVKGTKAIANDLIVKLPSALARSDAEIAHAAVNALRWHIQVPEDRIRVKVANGWLTLEGDVDRFYEKESAERAVRYLTGLKGMTNLITLHTTATPHDIKQRIRSSLQRQAAFDADQIGVETSGSRITLRGTVRSMAERGDAERAAWNAPGVIRVDNEITVSPPVPAAF
jgi:osmotically-inducible protein OsmY